MARRRVTVWRVLFVITVVTLGAMWIYVLSGAGDVSPPDTLDSTAFATTAEPICQATRTMIDELPPATGAATASDRADVVDQANQLLRDMVDRLRSIDAANPHDAHLVGLWLDDWVTYIGDRQDWADSIRHDPNAQFFEADRNGEQISNALDNLADVNGMPSCATTKDV